MMLSGDVQGISHLAKHGMMISSAGAKLLLIAESIILVASLYVTTTDSTGSDAAFLVVHPISVIVLLVTSALLWAHLEHLRSKLSKAERLVAHSTTEYGRIINQYFTDWKLTVSESQVAIYVMKGFSNAEIANLRGTSEATVKSQMNAIFRKSGASSRQNLVCFIFEDFARFVTEPDSDQLAAA